MVIFLAVVLMGGLWYGKMIYKYNIIINTLLTNRSCLGEIDFMLWILRTSSLTAPQNSFAWS